ncbi:MAG: hypothetical protein EOO99_11720 [Pedobacter sp.]|nr:MAG: hypothetical protein EOO99_11720 [Pedobacter sp.]
MIQIITEKKLIDKYQSQLVRQLKTTCIEKISCSLGHRGTESVPTTVFYSPELNFCFTAHDHINRYWNAFSLGKPQAGKSYPITAEINPPYEGINRTISGAFGKTSDGEILLLHRGNIGGSKVGVGKKLFFENYRDNSVLVKDGETENPFFIIGSIYSEIFPQQVLNFVKEVNRIKNLVNSNNISPIGNYTFAHEKFGENTLQNNKKITINRIHGIVVNKLATELKNRGHKVGNDSCRDLYVHKNGEIIKLFEIKSNSSTQSLYSAVGQLLIYSIPIKKAVSLIIVVPDQLKKDVVQKLRRLGIEVLYYEWRENQPIFKELESFLH